MTHSMKLNPAPFEMIACGKKTIELRLYDEKRRAIALGDTIVFTDTADEKRILHARVQKLHLFADFRELYEALPLLACGYTEKTVAAAHPSDMDAYYSAEQQRKYGVVGIEIEVLSEQN